MLQKHEIDMLQKHEIDMLQCCPYLFGPDSQETKLVRRTPNCSTQIRANFLTLLLTLLLDSYDSFKGDQAQTSRENIVTLI
jgi:hypothetical protein